ncbi:MAG: cell division protein FtsA [Prevotella sp.]|jgi:cell division protein FtsA|nr:cell division protein FtsA [Prevotella sp.]
MAAKEFIVAIELGSSKITGIAGRKNLDGSISVLAVVKEDATQCIRKGVVYNIDKTGQCLTNIISKLKNQLKSEIAKVYVGVGGQSIRSVRNPVVKDLPAETIVTTDMINELMDANRNMIYTDMEILDATTQEYKVDNQFQLDPVGIKANRLEGNFLNIIGRKSFYNNLNNCFDKAGIAIAEMYLAPLALADSVLTESEKRGGCLLVDLGADTTTVSVYYKNVLRHLAVIPLGGNNITKDIASLQMEEHDAERMKLRYGSAYTENSNIDNTLNYPIDQDRAVESRRFIEIVEARVEEIIENVWYQVPSEYVDKLLGGIVLTGGGSNMKDIERAFRNKTHIDKIRIAKFVNYTITSSNADITAHNGEMNTVLGLLAKGEINCAGMEINRNQDIFGAGKPAVDGGTTTAELHDKPRTPGEIAGKGVVMTAAEKEKAEEERRRKEEEERRRQEEEEEAQRIAEEERRKNSFWNKTLRGLKNFGKTLVEPDDE